MQASDKFKMALDIEPSKHDALWCLGNAYTSQVRILVVQIPAGTAPCMHCRHVCQLACRKGTLLKLRCLQGFLTTETMRALDFFEQATDCFRKALHEVSCTSWLHWHETMDMPCCSTCNLGLMSVRPSNGKYLSCICLTS